MCGLVGIYTINLNKHLPQTKCLFGEMLFADTLRGEDATGFALVSDKRKGNSKEVTIYKKAIAGYDFLQLAKTKKIIGGTSDIHLMMGHNRKGTTGSMEDRAAHPFKHGHITLCHNGTLGSYSHRPGGSKFDVDSEWIAWNIAEEGIEETLKKLNGSFALTWYDSNKKTFNVIRNSLRDLFWCPIQESDTIVYASEENLLRWAIERNKLSIYGDKKEIFLFEKNHLYEFKLGELDHDKTEMDMYEYPVRTIRQNSGYTPRNRDTGLTAIDIYDTEIAQEELTNLIGRQVAFTCEDVQELSRVDKKETGMRVHVLGKATELSQYNWFPAVKRIGYKCRILAKSKATEEMITEFKDNVWRGAVCGYSLHNEAKEIIVFVEDGKPTLTATIVFEGKSKRIVDKIQEEEEARKKKANKVKAGGDSSNRKKSSGMLLPYVGTPPLSAYDRDINRGDMIKGRSGVYVTPVEFYQQVARGCLCCGEILDSSDANHIVWTSEGQPICGGCNDKYANAGMPFILQ